jgi:hypothetical protein
VLFEAGTLSENQIVKTCKPESGRDQLPLGIQIYTVHTYNERPCELRKNHKLMCHLYLLLRNPILTLHDTSICTSVFLVSLQRAQKQQNRNIARVYFFNSAAAPISTPSTRPKSTNLPNQKTQIFVRNNLEAIPHVTPARTTRTDDGMR